MPTFLPFLSGLVAQQRRQAAELGDQEVAEPGDAVLVDAVRRPGDRDGGDDGAVDGPDGGADGGEPQLQLVERRRPAAPAHLDEGVVELGAVHRGVRGAALQVALRQRQRPEGVEHLAQRRAVRGHVDADPVRGADQVAAVDLVDLDERAAARHGEVHRLPRQLRQVLHRRAGQLRRGRAARWAGRRAGRTARRAGTRRPGRGAPAGCARAPAAAGRWWTSPGRARRRAS